MAPSPGPSLTGAGRFRPYVHARLSDDRSNRWLSTDRYNPAWTNVARRPKYVRNVWREIDNAIGAGTHYHDPERQYFYVLLELKIAVER